MSFSIKKELKNDRIKVESKESWIIGGQLEYNGGQQCIMPDKFG